MFGIKEKKLLEKKLERTESKVAILERLMEERASELYLSQEELKGLVADLEGAKADLEVKAEDLMKAHSATLNMLEDLQETKARLEESNLEIKNAKEKVEIFSKDLEKKIKERTSELEILYEVSNAMSYMLDYQQLIKLVMEALFKIVKYDVCAVLLYDESSSNMMIRPAFSQCAGFVDEVKENLLDAAASVAGFDVRRGLHHVSTISPELDLEQTAGREFDELRSFFNVPFIVRGESIGMIHVSSCSENAFNDENIKLIYTVANQASNAVERLQAVISAEQTKMESMVESMVEGVAMVDENGILLVLNPRARAFLGFDVEEKITDEMFKNKTEEFTLDEAIVECKSEKKIITREIEIEESVLKCDISPVRNEKDEVIGILLILRDVTEEREIDRMKTDFISTVSHELRTPLAITKEGISLILDNIPGDINEKQSKILITARDNIDRLARIINDLLDISRIEARKVELKRRVSDFSEVVKNIANTFGPQIKSKGLNLKLKVPNEKMEAFFDHDQIAQVLTNLIGNAVKFTPEGQIKISVKRSDGGVLCNVSDTGIGVVQSDVPKLFDKFKQFGRTHGPGQKGTGLGLSIAKGIVETHGGKIWAESRKGKGATFSFTLPEYREEEHLFERFDNQLRRSIDEDTHFSLAIVALKDVYRIDGKYGEDNTLEFSKKILKSMESQLRRTDIILGHRENEIIAGFPQTTEAGVRHIVQRLIDEFSKEIFDDFKLLVSVGVASFPKDGEVTAELLRAAQNKFRTIRVPLRNILIVDDDPHFIDIMKEWLEGVGYNVLSAVNGEAGIKIAESGTADLVVLDMRLPGMSGYEVIGHLKSSRKTENIPLVVSSAYEIDKKKLSDLATSLPIYPKSKGHETLTKIIRDYSSIK